MLPVIENAVAGILAQGVSKSVRLAVLAARDRKLMSVQAHEGPLAGPEKTREAQTENDHEGNCPAPPARLTFQSGRDL
jgi:hypothetical protein